MPKPYNYAQLYHRSDNARAIVESSDVDPSDTRPVGSVVSYEQYCAAVGVDVSQARRASLLSALYELVASDPIGRSMKQCEPWHGVPRPERNDALDLARELSDSLDWSVAGRSA